MANSASTPAATKPRFTSSPGNPGEDDLECGGLTPLWRLLAGLPEAGITMFARPEWSESGSAASVSRPSQSPVEPAHSKLGGVLKLVLDADPIGFEAVDGIDWGWRCGSLEPCGGTPSVLVGNGDESVFTRILLHVMESRGVARFVGQPRIPEVVPDFSAGCGVEGIDPSGGLAMEVAEEFRERGSIIAG